MVIENLDEIVRAHGGELAEQTLAYVAQALRRELRALRPVGAAERRGELLVVLPGADGPRGEIVARRALERLRTIKVEVDGARRPLRDRRSGSPLARGAQRPRTLARRRRGRAARAGTLRRRPAGHRQSGPD